MMNLDAEHNLANKFLGYTGEKSRPALDDFYKSNPGAAARMGEYSKAITGMAYGGYTGVSGVERGRGAAPKQEKPQVRPKARPTPAPTPKPVSKPNVPTIRPKARPKAITGTEAPNISFASSYSEPTSITTFTDNSGKTVAESTDSRTTTINRSSQSGDNLIRQAIELNAPIQFSDDGQTASVSNATMEELAKSKFGIKSGMLMAEHKRKNPAGGYSSFYLGIGPEGNLNLFNHQNMDISGGKMKIGYKSTFNEGGSVEEDEEDNISYTKDIIPMFGEAIEQTMSPTQSAVSTIMPDTTQDIAAGTGQTTGNITAPTYGVGTTALATAPQAPYQGPGYRINTTDEYIPDPSFKIPSSDDGVQAAVMPPMIKNPYFGLPEDFGGVTGGPAIFPGFGRRGAYTADTETVSEDVKTETGKLQAATTDIPESERVTAQKGTLGPGATPSAAEFNEQYLEKVTENKVREVSPEEMTQFAKVGIVPQSDAAQFDGPPQDAIAAKFETQTPQAAVVDQYNLTPSQFAQQAQTSVQDAARLSQIPTAQAAASSFQSTVQGAQGQVGSQELANANNIIGAEQAVTSIAATMDTLNQQAIAQAAQGTFSQSMLATAAQGTVDPAQTVQGQMNSLMEQFKNGTPVWAAGAMRAANAAMASRGLAGSSMAGAAIVQATMEAAIPIAAQDAQFYQNVGMANLNNRQQVSIANAAAQQNITLQNLNNNQQVALQNSTNAFALQSASLSNQQSTVLANAQMKAALQNSTLDIKTQTALTNAAKYSEMNKINLSNTQQANLQKSSENLQVNMQNLSNSQQTALSNLQVRASLTGQELSNEQQVAMLQSTQDFERAGFDATAKQQAFLQDAQAQAALEGRAMDIRQQTQLFNVSKIIEERGIELTNEQQTRLFNTTNKLQRDVTEVSNRQQTALANVQIEATLRGQELNNEQQAAVLDSEKFAEANNLTFTTNQQSQLANSQLMQSIGLANLNSAQATTLQNAAQLASMDMQNLNNRQQAAVQNAQNFLSVNLANLTNEQQAAIFKSQQNVQALFTDQAAENATSQFNASSENQVAQYFAGLASQTSQFNASQQNAVNQFNVDAKNSIGQFNANLQNQRDQFNANNGLVIAQANAQWRQNIATLNTAAQNESNMNFAKTINSLTSKNLDQIWQRERDLMQYNFTSAESAKDRALSILMGDKELEALKNELGYKEDTAKTQLLFRFLFGSGGTGLLG